MGQRQQRIMDNLEQYRLGSDDTFRFKCRGCGKCCKNREDIILTTSDLYNIAKKLGMTIEAVIDKYCESYIGSTSRIPIVRLKPGGINNSCPLLNGKRCLVHDAKPTVCALYPLGRAFSSGKEEAAEIFGDAQAVYFIQPVECGSLNRNNTVRSWLAKFAIPLEDEFYLLWSETVMFLAEYFRGIEDNTNEKVLDTLWTIAFGALYAAYDTGVGLIPQFRKNAEKLKQLLLDIQEKKGRLDALKVPSGGENHGG